jgi:hypothetical protein
MKRCPVDTWHLNRPISADSGLPKRNTLVESLNSWTSLVGLREPGARFSCEETGSELVDELLEEVDWLTTPASPVKQSTVHSKPRRKLSSKMSSHNDVGFSGADTSKRILSSLADALIDMKDVPEDDAILSKALEGHTSVSPPFSGLKDESGPLRTGDPSMFLCGPVLDISFQVVAVLGLRIPPDPEFTRLLQLGGIGKTGETYAFDKSGRLVSNRLFDNALIPPGLLPDQPQIELILNLSLRDPQGDMTQSFRPRVRRNELPRTTMTADCIAGNLRQNVDGYRDYRGVAVIGTWRWLARLRSGCRDSDRCDRGVPAVVHYAMDLRDAVFSAPDLLGGHLRLFNHHEMRSSNRRDLGNTPLRQISAPAAWVLSTNFCMRSCVDLPQLNAERRQRE